jgi:hypothetical protein
VLSGERSNASIDCDVDSGKGISLDAVWVDETFNVELEHC